jgi:ABC-type branched-subunit amino acid transport system substrate-binding protein
MGLKTWRRPAALALALVAGAGAVAGCGSGEDGASGGGETDGGGAGTIKLRAVAAEGSGLTNYPDVQVGARAAAEAINREGGVGGRKIELSFCNTRGEANQAMTCARDAVKDDVAAIVGRVDIFATQSTPVYEKGGIPDVGGLPAGAETEYTSKVAYPLHTGNYGAFTAAPYAFKAAGRKRMVTVALDFPATLNQASVVAKAAKVAGMPSAGVIKIPSQGVTDYSPYAQQIKERGADSALILLGPAGLQSMYKAVASTGVKAQFAGTVFSFGESEARAIGAASDGIWVMSPFPSPRDTSDPGIKAFGAELDAAGVGQDPELRRSAGLNAWLAVHAAAKVAAGIKGDVTPKSMTAALDRTRDLDVEGLVTWSPADYGKDAGSAFPRFPTSAFRVLTFEGGRLSASDVAPVEDPLKGVR